jgi:hypothetical protein
MVSAHHAAESAERGFDFVFSAETELAGGPPSAVFLSFTTARGALLFTEKRVFVFCASE